MSENDNFLDTVCWNDAGLVCAIAQDSQTGQVLMLAWMNREALMMSIDSGYAHYYSRSRQKLWKKGEQSGHVQRILEIRLDCDGDAILMKIDQNGLACHTGRPSCFYRKFEQGRWVVTDKVIKPEAQIYQKTIAD